MEVKDPVPTVSIPLTAGKRTIMVPLSTPEECDALIAEVCAAKAMIIAAAAALAAWQNPEPVDCETADDDAPETCGFRYLDAGGTARSCQRRPGGRVHDEHWQYDDNHSIVHESTVPVIPAGLAVLDAQPGDGDEPGPMDDDAELRRADAIRNGDPCACGHPAREHHVNMVKGTLTYCNECAIGDYCAVFTAAAEPEPGTQAYADKYSSRAIQQAFDEPVIPVTHLACGDQLHDQGAAYLAVGAVAWCAVHGNTEVISADEWAAAWQAEEAAPAAPVLALVPPAAGQ
jgi:hypothetical protein